MSEQKAQALYMAVIDCPHEIEHNKIVLHFTAKREGNNALDQLARRLAPFENQLTAPRGTGPQIQTERKLTCEMIDGAIALGYRGDQPPEPGHWLEPYWKMGRDRAEYESANPSEADRAKLRHMLGADTDKHSQWGYRNYYATSGGPAMAALERMQTLGLVTLYRIDGNMKYYAATEAGCKAVGLTEKQIKRALEG